MPRRTCTIGVGNDEEVEVSYADFSPDFYAEICYKDEETEEDYVSRARVSLRFILEDEPVDTRRDIKKAHIQAAVDKVIDDHVTGDFEVTSLRVKEEKTVRRWWRDDEE